MQKWRSFYRNFAQVMKNLYVNIGLLKTISNNWTQHPILWVFPKTDMEFHLSDFELHRFSNEPITKMHDSLPLQLFVYKNKCFIEALYKILISLCFHNLVDSTRLYLLEISFWFLVYYYEKKNNQQNFEYTETKKEK